MAPRISGTVSKALDILDLFGGAQQTWTATEISRATDIHKSTVVRLCATLAARGYLERGPQGYRLGPQIGALGRRYESDFDFEALMRSVLRQLRDSTGESASYYMVEGRERICVFRENSYHSIRHVVDEGARLPVDKGVVGRVLLAFSGAQGQPYEAIRQDGFLNAEGREPLTASVAAPVVDGAGLLQGALVVSGPSSRFGPRSRQSAVQQVLEACSRIAEVLPGKQGDSQRLSLAGL